MFEAKDFQRNRMEIWTNQANWIGERLRHLSIRLISPDINPNSLKKPADDIKKQVEILVRQINDPMMDQVGIKNKQDFAQQLLNSVADLHRQIDHKIAQHQHDPVVIDMNGFPNPPKEPQRLKQHLVIEMLDEDDDDEETLQEMTRLQKSMNSLKEIFSHLSGMVKQQGELVDSIENNLESAHENTIEGVENISGALNWMNGKRGLLSKIGIGVAFVVGIICFIWLICIEWWSASVTVLLNHVRFEINLREKNIWNQDPFNKYVYKIIIVINLNETHGTWYEIQGYWSTNLKKIQKKREPRF